jgi:hypothetical protein
MLVLPAGTRQPQKTSASGRASCRFYLTEGRNQPDDSGGRNAPAVGACACGIGGVPVSSPSTGEANVQKSALRRLR